MHNFDLRIRGDDGGYRVEVLASPAGETPVAVPVPAPRQDPAFERILAALRRFRVAPHEVQTLGTVLWQCLFPPPIAGRYTESLGLAGDEGLRIRLRIDPPELQMLPWEYLYNPETQQFLALSRQHSLVRYIPLPQPVPPLQVEGPLRVLVMISSPMDQPALAVEKECQLIESALTPLIEIGAVELVMEIGGRFSRLQKRLQQGVHVLHYIGHGVMVRGQGHLVMENENRASQFVGASVLEPLLGGTALRCIVLTACESAGGAGDPFLGLAPALIRGGVPAVVAMQMPMPDESAVVFSEMFYHALALRQTIDVCVTEGRLGIRGALPENRIDWGIPALFSRSDDGILFASRMVEATVEAGAHQTSQPVASPEGGVHIQGSTVTVHGDLAGRDVIKSSGAQAESTVPTVNVRARLREMWNRLFGGKLA